MLKELQAFAKSLGNSSMETESNMLDNTLQIYRSFGVEGIPLLIEELKLTDKQDMVTALLVDLGLGRKNTNIEKLEKLKSFSEDVLANENKIKDLLSSLPNYFTDKSMSLKSAAMLDMLDDLNNIALYSSDLLMSIAFAIGGQDYMLTRKAKKFLSLKQSFNLLFTLYNNNLESKLTGIERASTIAMKDVEKGDLTKDDTKMNPVISGFVGNPIYHIRKAWVDVEMYRINQLKDKKLLFEARIIELRTLRENGNTKDVSKQIEYYQKQIEKTEYKIHKLSEV